MNRKKLHPATLAAQALGWTDPSTGAVVLPIHTATTFLRDPDNQYRRGRSYGRADNPSYDQPQALMTALEGGAATLLFSSGHGSGRRRLPEPCRAARMSSHRGSCIGDCAAGSKNFAEAWGIAVDFVDATSLDALRRAVRAGPDPARVDRNPGQPAVVGDRYRRRRRDRALRRRPARRRQHRRDPGADPASGARRRPRHAFGDKIPERPQRRDRRDVDDGARGRRSGRGRRTARSSGGAILGSFEAYLLLRGMRTLYPAGRARLPLGAADRRGDVAASAGARRALSRACRSTPVTRSRRAR